MIVKYEEKMIKTRRNFFFNLGHGYSDNGMWCDNEQAVTVFLDGLNKILNINLTENTIQVLYTAKYNLHSISLFFLLSEL